MRRAPLALTLAAVAVTACTAQSGSGAASTSAATATTQAAAPAATTAAASSSAAAGTLTAEGFGPVRVGMTQAEALAALGAGWRIDEGAEPRCTFIARGEDGATFEGYRVVDGRVAGTRVDNYAPNAGQVTTVTDRGVGLGSTAAQVRTAYGTALSQRATPQNSDNTYLTAWSSGAPASPGAQPGADARGVRFLLDDQGVVVSVSAGAPPVLTDDVCG